MVKISEKLIWRLVTFLSWAVSLNDKPSVEISVAIRTMLSKKYINLGLINVNWNIVKPWWWQSMVSRFLKQWTWDKTILALFWSYSYLYCSGGYKIREFSLFSFVLAAPVMHGKLVRKADKLCTWNTSILIGQLGVSCSFDWLTKVRQMY